MKPLPVGVWRKYRDVAKALRQMLVVLGEVAVLIAVLENKLSEPFTQLPYSRIAANVWS